MYLCKVTPASSIFEITSPQAFRKKALELFRLQAKETPVYREYVQHLSIDPLKIENLEDVPYLPISLFKTRNIIARGKAAEITFTSSGTTGSAASRHPVADLEIYHRSFRHGFEHFYGNIRDYRILALLPGYLERKGSSLVLMAEEMITLSGHPESGFFLYDHDQLLKTLLDLEEKQLPTLLLGVSHALLDFTEKHRLRLQHTIVMETGGMKGRKKEMIREELHGILQERLGLPLIHSEYGMTELLSQAYSQGKGRFRCPPWMKALTREYNDPFSLTTKGRTGGLNIIDLANIHSCSFIATDDLGKLYPDGSFEVLGRFDNSDIRGCNLMVG